MTTLASALNGRKGGAAGVPVRLEDPVPAAAAAAPLALRPLRAGEIGTRSGPRAEYSEDALRALLIRVSTGAGFVHEHLDDPQGARQCGLLVQLAEDLSVMLRLHMAQEILYDS